jgi:hypothetical protein
MARKSSIVKVFVAALLVVATFDASPAQHKYHGQTRAKCRRHLGIFVLLSTTSPFHGQIVQFGNAVRNRPRSAQRRLVRVRLGQRTDRVRTGAGHVDDPAAAPNCTMNGRRLMQERAEELIDPLRANAIRIDDVFHGPTDGMTRAILEERERKK